MEESTVEVVIGMAARLGIIGAHSVELIAGVHTIAIVAVLWSIEEIVSVQFNARKLRKERAATLEAQSLVSLKSNKLFDTADSERKWT